MIKAFEIIPKHLSLRLCTCVLKKILQLLIGFLLIALTLGLDVVLEDNATILPTQVLDYVILILFLTQLSIVTDAMEYAIRIVQKNLIVIIHTASIVSTLSYTINIRILTREDLD